MGRRLLLILKSNSKSLFLGNFWQYFLIISSCSISVVKAQHYSVHLGWIGSTLIIALIIGAIVLCCFYCKDCPAYKNRHPVNYANQYQNPPQPMMAVPAQYGNPGGNPYYGNVQGPPPPAYNVSKHAQEQEP